MKKENLSSRARRELQNGTASKESHDAISALRHVVGPGVGSRVASGR
jgi:hypothetical protein